jgi:DNA-binding NarL/FixJ family response regulator
MSLRSIVHVTAHLVRQPIVQSLRALDFEVNEAADLAGVVSILGSYAPDLIIMDADGMARQWRKLAAGLGGTQSNAGLVLLASRFSFEDAHDAQALQVAGVIMKPYRRAEHAVRLLDAALARRGLRARRTTPRLLLGLELDSEASLQVSLPAGEKTLAIRDIGEGGAAVNQEPYSVGAFADGEFIPAATLTWGDVRVEAVCDVAYLGTDRAGLSFSRLYEGKARLSRAIDERLSKALGAVQRKRRW